VKNGDLGYSSRHDGVLPFPIYIAIETTLLPYEWIEFNPFEMGSSYLSAYIPVWAFGRTFNNGTSTNRPPQQTLGYLLDIFGSAFEITLQDALLNSASAISLIMKNIPSLVKNIFGATEASGIIQDILEVILPTLLQDFFTKWLQTISGTPLPQLLLSPAWQPNYTSGITNNPFATQSKLTLVDAGIDFNIPVPPLLRAARAIDIIIIYDTSATLSSQPLSSTPLAQALAGAQKYAQDRGLKFPPIAPIDYSRAGKELVSIFKDPNDPKTPTVIYMPSIANSAYTPAFDIRACILNGYCATANFNYTQSQAQQLSAFSRFALLQNITAIKQTIQGKINSKPST
jgi:cytosolic phospholipase A2